MLTKILLVLYIVKKLKIFWIKTIKITKQSHVYNGYTSNYNADIFNSLNPELKLTDTESTIKNELIDLLSELRGFQFVTILVLEFKKIESDDETKYTIFYSNSKSETISSESDIDDVFEWIYTTVVSNIQKSLRKGSSWIIDSVIDHITFISRRHLLALSSLSSYIKLPKVLNHPKKIWLMFKILMIMNALNGV